jgi:hypothetical protein
MTLETLFERYNKRFFGGKLEGWTIFEAHLSDSRNGFHGEFGNSDTESKQIAVQIGLSAAERRKTLLHEMCHAVTPSEDNLIHGQPWQGEMFRIGRLGAEGTAKEARWYRRKLEKI